MVLSQIITRLLVDSANVLLVDYAVVFPSRLDDEAAMVEKNEMNYSVQQGQNC